MSYYNQGGYYGGGGGGGPQQQQQQPPDPSQSYVYGQQQQQQPSYSNNTTQQPDPYATYVQPQSQPQYNNNEHPNMWQQNPSLQQQQYPQQQQPIGYSNQIPSMFGAPNPHSSNNNTPFFNPNMAVQMAAMAATGLSGNQNAILDMASSAGQTFWQSSTARMVPGLESTMQVLRQYFAVDNRYVLQKMKRVAFPFLFKTWKRTAKEVAPTSDNRILPLSYLLPLHDDCAPDLYLPLMSGITYVLLSALLYGTAGKFNPEVIPDVCTKCFITQILEVLAIRLGFYVLRVSNIAFLDLFCYTGYKYQGLCLNMLIGLLLKHFNVGSRGYYGSFLYTGSAAAYFMLKTTANNIPLNLPPGTPPRDLMVLAFAMSQFATMWFVGQTKFL